MEADEMYLKDARLLSTDDVVFRMLSTIAASDGDVNPIILAYICELLRRRSEGDIRATTVLCAMDFVKDFSIN